jgi:hypothetical protein
MDPASGPGQDVIYTVIHCDHHSYLKNQDPIHPRKGWDRPTEWRRKTKSEPSRDGESEQRSLAPE